MLWNDPNKVDPEFAEKYKAYVADLRALMKTVPASDSSIFLSALVYVTAAGFSAHCGGPGRPQDIAQAMTASAIGTATQDPQAGKEAIKQMITFSDDPLNLPKTPGRG